VVETFRSTKLATSIHEMPDASARKIEMALEDWGANRAQHGGGRSLYEHLLGTRDLLKAWGASLDIQNAGFFHSIYSTEVYQTQLLSYSQRVVLRDLIGVQAERLTYLFSVIARRDIYRMAAAASTLITGNFTLETIPNLDVPEKNIEVAAEDLTALLVLHLANRVEQKSTREPEPGGWLQQFSSFVKFLHSKSSFCFPLHVPKELNKAEAFEFRYSYLRACSALALEPEQATKHLEKCLSICDWVFEPWFLLSYAHLASGDVESSGNALERAIELMKFWQVPWDKRLPLVSWQKLCDSLRKGASFDDPVRRAAPCLEILKSICEGTGFPDFGVENSKRFFSYLESISPQGDRQALGWYPGLTSKPVYETNKFSIVKDLEDNFPAIKSEIEALSSKGFHRESEQIARQGNWDVYMLYEQGLKNEANCTALPTITTIVERHSCVRKTGGLIYLSRLGPQSSVAAHNGPVNYRLRLHLGIRIPDGDCGMRVEDTISTWKEGKCLVFDDFLEHEVWNKTDRERIVLLLDLWHPDLSPQECSALDTFQWYATQRAMNQVRYWDKNRKAKDAKEALQA
jgi:hypothetical protein